MHNRQGAESAKKFKNLASLAFLAVKNSVHCVQHPADHYKYAVLVKMILQSRIEELDTDFHG